MAHTSSPTTTTTQTAVQSQPPIRVPSRKRRNPQRKIAAEKRHSVPGTSELMRKLNEACIRNKCVTLSETRARRKLGYAPEICGNEGLILDDREDLDLVFGQESQD